MISKYSNFDSYVFLFSVDWAKPFIKSLLNVDSAQSHQINDAAKKAVKQLMGAASNYYEISFTEERKLETEQTLLESLSDEEAKKAVIDFIVELEQGGNEHISHQANIVWGILLQTESHESLFGEKNHERFGGLIKSLDGQGDEFFEGLDENSKSEWDLYVRSLKPESETHVSDFFLIHVYERRSFNIFWGYVKAYLNNDRVDKIKSILSSNYSDLTGASLNASVFT